MMAIRFEPTERNLATLYDRPSPGLRFSRKNLMAFAAVGLLYAGFGAAVMSYKITHKPEVFVTPPTVSVTSERMERKIDNKPLKPATTQTKIHNPTQPPTTQPNPPFTSTSVGDGPIPDGPIVDVTGETIGTVTPPPGPTMIKNPDWVSRPTAAQLGRVYPDRAVDKDVSGAATLLCGVAADGSMVGCTVIDEAPKGWRFGQAALAAARYFKMSPRTVDGQVVEGAKVRIPIVFTLG
jgi:protein TonB